MIITLLIFDIILRFRLFPVAFLQIGKKGKWAKLLEISTRRWRVKRNPWKQEICPTCFCRDFITISIKYYNPKTQEQIPHCRRRLYSKIFIVILCEQFHGMQIFQRRSIWTVEKVKIKNFTRTFLFPKMALK